MPLASLEQLEHSSWCSLMQGPVCMGSTKVNLRVHGATVRCPGGPPMVRSMVAFLAHGAPVDLGFDFALVLAIFLYVLSNQHRPARVDVIPTRRLGRGCRRRNFINDLGYERLEPGFEQGTGWFLCTTSFSPSPCTLRSISVLGRLCCLLCRISSPGISPFLCFPFGAIADGDDAIEKFCHKTLRHG
jgi:hypothetical protein